MKMQFKSIFTAALLGATITLADNNSDNTDIPSSCTIGSKATATAQSDLDKIANCQTLVGNLTITGELDSAALNNVEVLKGSLVLKNATELNNFSADNLKAITGSLTLNDLTTLTSASFRSLKRVDTIDMVTLPAISNFITDLQSANNILVSDTALRTVDGFSTLKKVNVLNINNNRFLTSFNSDLRSVVDVLDFSFNGQEAEISFDDLIWANNITIRGVQEASLSSLKYINASLGFINNTISKINMSKLKQVGRSLIIDSNSELTSADFSNLHGTENGDFIITNNPKLKKIDGFKKFNVALGAITITGSYDELDLPKLRVVSYNATFITTSSIFSCFEIEELQKMSVFDGDSFICKTGANSSSKNVSSIPSSSSSEMVSSIASTSSSSSEKVSSITSSKDSKNSETKSLTDASSSSSTSKSEGFAVQNLVPGTSFVGVLSAIMAALL
ncbi:cell wall protein Ecm33p [Monosporozyma servazzii]